MDNEVAMPKFKENEKVLCFHDKLLYEVFYWPEFYKMYLLLPRPRSVVTRLTSEQRKKVSGLTPYSLL